MDVKLGKTALMFAVMALGACSAMPDLGMSSRSAFSPDGWTSLFNGRNLEGWNIGYAAKPQDNRPPSAMFEVRDGAIHTYPREVDGTTQPNAYLQTQIDYSDYRISLEYRWGTKRFAPRLG